MRIHYMRDLILQIEGITEGEYHLIPNMANISAILMMNMKDINWAGFYTYQEDEDKPYLLLGPFAGKPACLRIKIGSGVCGTAVSKDRMMIVPDVHEFPGHIACDAASRSEIVIPIHKNGKIIGVLDIDSPIKDRFSEEDGRYLTEVVQILEQRIAG